MIKPFNKTKNGFVTNLIGYAQLIITRNLKPLPVFNRITTGPLKLQGTYQTLPHRGDFKIVRKVDRRTGIETLRFYRFESTQQGLEPLEIQGHELQKALQEELDWFMRINIKIPGPVFLPIDKIEHLPPVKEKRHASTTTTINSSSDGSPQETIGTRIITKKKRTIPIPATVI